MMRERSNVSVESCLFPSCATGRFVGVGHLIHDSIEVGILQTGFCLDMLNIGEVTDVLRLIEHAVKLLDCVFPSAKNADLTTQLGAGSERRIGRRTDVKQVIRSIISAMVSDFLPFFRCSPLPSLALPALP
jgi:hypothetical protein